MAKTRCFAWLLIATAPLSASGAIRFELPQVTVLTEGAVPVTGAFDVLVQVAAADLPRQVSSLNVDLRVGSSNVTLGPPQTPPAPLLAGAVTNFSPNPQTIRAALDTFPNSSPLKAGAQLVRVPFSIAAGAQGAFSLEFGSFNQLTDANASSLPLLLTDVGSITAFYAADFDEDFEVDVADLSNWTLGFGSSAGATHLQGDADGDGDADGFDFLVWQRQRGGPTGQLSSTTAVPEPPTLLLLLLGVLAKWVLRRVEKVVTYARMKRAGMQPH